MTGPQSGAGRRRKGARAEADLINYLQANGYPHAERRRIGVPGPDVTGTPGVAWECKSAARIELAAWVDQAEQQRADTRAVYGPLVVKRRGTTDVGQWYAVLPMAQLMALLAEAGWTAPVLHSQPTTTE